MVPFTLLHKVSDGSAVEMYLAHRQSDDTSVIVELARPELMADPVATKTFLSELAARRRLEHPNVARRDSVGTVADGRHFAMSEPLQHGSLAAWVSTRGPLPWRDAARVVLPLCQALDYLHRHGLTHGNVRAECVYLTGPLGTGTPKLVDSGLTLLRSPGVLAAPGAVLVMPEYLSPERAQGHRAGPAGDIYGLGLLLYELVTGAPPYRGAHPGETRRLHVEAPLPLLPPAAVALQPLVKRCLEKRPEDRWPTAEAMGHALDEVLHAREVMGWGRSGLRSTWRGLAMPVRAALVVAVVALVGMLAWAGWPARPTTSDSATSTSPSPSVEQVPVRPTDTPTAAAPVPAAPAVPATPTPTRTTPEAAPAPSSNRAAAPAVSAELSKAFSNAAGHPAPAAPTAATPWTAPAQMAPEAPAARPATRAEEAPSAAATTEPEPAAEKAAAKAEAPVEPGSEGGGAPAPAPTEEKVAPPAPEATPAPEPTSTPP